MSDEQTVIGGAEPIFGLVFGVGDQAFRSNDGGRRFYTATMASGDAAEHLSVGLDILIDGWVQRDDPEFPVPMFDGEVRLRSTGEGTKRLAKTWSRTLGIPYTLPGVRLGNVICEAVAFEGDPADMQSTGFKGKLWLGENGDVDECQVFLRVLPPLKQAWFGEKSPEDTRNFFEWLTRLG